MRFIVFLLKRGRYFHFGSLQNILLRVARIAYIPRNASTTPA